MTFIDSALAWARTEAFASLFFAAAGVVFLVFAVCCWQFGKAPQARAFTVPAAVAAGLLIVLGIGLFTSYYARTTSFPAAHAADAQAFLASETARVEKVLGEYQVAVFRVIPALIALSGVLVMFINGPVWRASLIMIIAMLAIVMVIDSTAIGRLKEYQKQLQLFGQT